MLARVCVCRPLPNSDTSAPGTDARVSDMQAVVFTCANLDSAYFVLLDHFLTCGWAAPPIPPPHDYFPAIAAMHPGCRRLNAVQPDVYLDGATIDYRLLSAKRAASVRS